MIQRSRREFLHETFSACGAFGVTAALHALGARLAYGEEYKTSDSLIPVADETTGLELLRLPSGFRYRSFGWSGDTMSDGALTPTEHDGMGVVQCEDQIVKLVRNHERSGHGDVLRSDRTTAYDPEANGGCTTLTFDLKNGEWKESWTSIAGTSRNCAGGITPWGTWLTCEETVMGTNAVDHYKDDVQRTFQKTHGWIFEVDPDGVTDPTPLMDMGRFVHEAVAIDQDTGISLEMS
ncbi:MAG: alkaline phosphatase PhoX [Planctomycetota bacterium]